MKRTQIIFLLIVLVLFTFGCTQDIKDSNNSKIIENEQAGKSRILESFVINRTADSQRGNKRMVKILRSAVQGTDGILSLCYDGG